MKFLERALEDEEEEEEEGSDDSQYQDEPRVIEVPDDID